MLTKHPIRIMTLYGSEQYYELYKQREHYKKTNQLNEFKQRCLEDYKIMSQYLEFFLNDDVLARRYKMDDNDSEGWQKYREMNDIIEALKWFGESVYVNNGEQ